MSHSKRNTSSSFFTSYERSLLKTAWGSQKTRLTRESFLPFSSCQLCLLSSRDPVVCPNGDLFCRECAMSNLLSQRQEIQRLEKEMERKREEDVERDALQEEEERAEVVKEFELGLLGLDGQKKRDRGDDKGSAALSRENSKDVAAEKGIKRKFEIDETELLRIAAEDRRKARKEIDTERKANSSYLPSFWVPGAEHPESTIPLHEITKSVKLHPLCPASSEAAPHLYALKTLTTVNFTEEPNPKNPAEKLRSCPACRKALSNATKAVVAIPCGHVLCKPCNTKFMTPISTADPHHPEIEHSVLRCYVCETDLSPRQDNASNGASATVDGADVNKSKKKKKRHKDNDEVKPGLVEIKSDGTGFAGSGGNMVERRGVAFQC